MKVVIAKKVAAQAAFRAELSPSATVKRWWWIASGTTKITRGMPEARLLDQAGIVLVGSRLTLPG